MALLAPVDPVDHLIDEFLTVSRQAQTQAWRLWELAAAVYEAGGPSGLHRLADATHYHYHTLRGWVTLLPRFPAALRAQFSSLSPELFRTADWARRQFADGLPEATLEHWLALTVSERLTRNQLRVRVLARRDQIQLAHNPAAIRQRQLIRLADRAESLLSQMERLAEQFNRTYAPYALCTVAITRTPLTLP